MNVSSYLEAFLSVYGWAVYRTMFLLFMMTGLFLYPILRSLIGLLIDFLSSGRDDAYGYLKQAGVVIALTIAPSRPCPAVLLFSVLEAVAEPCHNSFPVFASTSLASAVTRVSLWMSW